uniref:Uncharacterized protein n=1 Tax=Vespula pensylvanica TaxID=30213 RepID=A0A834UD16_VESPE|nr:hypothetical protein H0235_004974 [Vespula pensylvanica]
MIDSAIMKNVTLRLDGKSGGEEERKRERREQEQPSCEVEEEEEQQQQQQQQQQEKQEEQEQDETRMRTVSCWNKENRPRVPIVEVIPLPKEKRPWTSDLRNDS